MDKPPRRKPQKPKWPVSYGAPSAAEAYSRRFEGACVLGLSTKRHKDGLKAEIRAALRMAKEAGVELPG